MEALTERRHWKEDLREVRGKPCRYLGGEFSRYRVEKEGRD